MWYDIDMSYLCEQIPVLHISGQLDQDGALRWESLSGNTFVDPNFGKITRCFIFFWISLKDFPVTLKLLLIPLLWYPFSILRLG